MALHIGEKVIRRNQIKTLTWAPKSKSAGTISKEGASVHSQYSA